MRVLRVRRGRAALILEIAPGGHAEEGGHPLQDSDYRDGRTAMDQKEMKSLEEKARAVVSALSELESETRRQRRIGDQLEQGKFKLKWHSGHS